MSVNSVEKLNPYTESYCPNGYFKNTVTMIHNCLECPAWIRWCRAKHVYHFCFCVCCYLKLTRCISAWMTVTFILYVGDKTVVCLCVVGYRFICTFLFRMLNYWCFLFSGFYWSVHWVSRYLTVASFMISSRGSPLQKSKKCFLRCLCIYKSCWWDGIIFRCLLVSVIFD